ncbi:sugar ABC transporter ATP-binding protein [Mesorhizobium sp. B3-1-6]|uniref:sugar ABC transporter ATP-binding protein n=1 Tax=Mesorhizobium sp. B3-1-6 TaxID=2589895 RepID=UPI0011290615|nr:sugar ABC transporter ATP-binding protein [Mesorhizobium sp. B3-1-6]TPI41465.1 sugar ABC transporter ATP-binding protein [Mesorhizobium sp. B3-1-6]
MAELSRENAPLLSVRAVSKSFGGTRALDGVSLDLNAGETLALLGENGAGKSTLIKILANVYTQDAGDIDFRGTQVSGPALRRLPITFIHQDLGLIEWMTVAENICLTLGYPMKNGLIDWDQAARRAGDALGHLGAVIDPEIRVQSLSRIEKSLVAIARALAANAEVIVLDEPTASLPADEVTRLFSSLRQLSACGVGLIYVSHRLDEVFEIADRVVVLRDGQVAGERSIAGTTPEELILLIVGRQPAPVARTAPQKQGAPRLIFERTMIGSAGPVSGEIYAGEIVGLVGLRGAGQENIGRALFGLAPATSGLISLDGVPIRPANPKQAMDLGINFVGADRVGESVVPNLSIRENFFLNPVAAGRRLLSFLLPGPETRRSRKLGEDVGLRPNDPALAIELLSGGNQQKVIVGRWLHVGGKVYVLADPTAGVDVGARAEIYRLFEMALKAGAAILIVSTDFEEVAKVCHRALVFDRGKVVAEIDRSDLSTENLIAAASARVTPAQAGNRSPHANDQI